MKCSNHNLSDAVGSCSSCGRGLCPECIDRYESPSCMSCARSINKSRKYTLYFQISLIVILVFSIGLVAPISLYVNDQFHEPINFLNIAVAFLGFAFFPYGASAVSKKAPIFICNVIIALVLFPIYFFLSLFVGYVAGPLKFVSMVRELRTIKLTEKIDREYERQEGKEAVPIFNDVEFNRKEINDSFFH